MLVREKVYLKKFSKILNLQEEEQISYGLIKQNNGEKDIYGVEIKSLYSNKKDCCRVEGLSDNEGKVLNIIKYLYENSVRADICKDIIEDFSKKKILF